VLTSPLDSLQWGAQGGFSLSFLEHLLRRHLSHVVKLAHPSVTDIKTKIQAEVDAMLDDFRGAAPSEKVALAKAITALASALPEFATADGGGLRKLLATLSKTQTTETDD
jgi:hypothetical protein